MNERIEKLGEQADLLGEFTPTRIHGRYVGYITEEQILKFAELIIEECIKQVNKDHFGGRESWDRSLDNAIRNIKEHFGI